MKTKKNQSKLDQVPFRPKIRAGGLLFWVATISLGISGSLFYALKDLAQNDVVMAQRRMLVLLIGVVISGTCIIIGTSHRWFYPK
jgi:hypothetical protein